MINLPIHQYIQRDSGQVVTEQLFSDRLIHLLYAHTREHAAGAVRTVRGRRQPEHHDAGRRIPEPRDRTAPVLLVGECGPLGRCDLLAPGDEPWTGAALDEGRLEVGQRGGSASAE